MPKIKLIKGKRLTRFLQEHSANDAVRDFAIARLVFGRTSLAAAFASGYHAHSEGRRSRRAGNTIFRAVLGDEELYFTYASTESELLEALQDRVAFLPKK